MLRNTIFSFFYVSCIIGQLQAPDLPYRLYHSDRVYISNMYYDCLLFNEAYEPLENTYMLGEHSPYEIIPYCIRPFDQFVDTSIDNTIQVTHGTPITFETLRNQKLTSQQLYLSSVPIDIIEQYQEFLESTHSSLSAKTIYNCTIPWFGEFCQYTFNSTLLFNTLVRNDFQNKLSVNEELVNGTCFTLLKCNRGPPPACLDWREVCDGKIDCLDDGIDEVGCEDLDNTECTGDEFRCGNGFCIPNDFFDDNLFNPDCVDRSDERDSIVSVSYFGNCPIDPAFRCEETACRNEHESICSPLGCRLLDCDIWNNPLRRGKYSWNGNDHLSYDCWTTLICLTVKKYIGLIFNEVDCSTDDISQVLFEESCPAVFFFPSQPLLLNHVRLVYGTNFINESFRDNIFLPYYVCYDERLCDFLPSTIFINGSSCLHLSEIIIKDDIFSWWKFEDNLLSFFQKCSSKNNSYDPCPKSKPYRCANSSKCLPLNRLVDGIKDCFQGDDEDMLNSCLLADKTYRFRCEAEDKCFPIAAIGQTSLNCLRFENNSDQLQQALTAYRSFPLVFLMLCDGFVQYTVIDGVNDTDEMDCEHWPCNNVYTRCDDSGTWHCLNGADEVDCPRNPCRPDGHPCLLPNNYTLVCLPLSKFNDGIIDCLGAYDERAYCRAYSLDDHLSLYRCFNTTTCVRIHAFCRLHSDPCLSDENTLYSCKQDVFHPSHYCDDFFSASWSITSDPYFYLCSLSGDEHIFGIKSFILTNHVNYPIQDLTINADIKNHITTNDIVSDQIWTYESTQEVMSDKTDIYCYRGISIYSNDLSGTYCLCPPAYFGCQCQYQSQRISLTLQFRTAEWRTHFSFVIMLIDNHTNIHSYEQIDFLSVRDCRKKFNIYLLYSNRPKLLNYTYDIRIDTYDKMKMKYYTSFLYPVQFPFLPVHRLAFQVDIPLQAALFVPKKCPLKCSHGQCTRFQNLEQFFCHCFSGYSGPLCTMKNDCHCSPGSICVGTSTNRSICVCPANRFGPRCYLNTTACLSHSCSNDSQCISTDVKLSEADYFCLCPSGSTGPKCENKQLKIEFYFDKNISIPQSMLIHFLVVPSLLSRDDFIEDSDSTQPIQTTQITKINYSQKSIIIYYTNPFHLIFIQLNEDYYLALLQHTYTSVKHLSTTILPQHRCKPIEDLLNQQIQSLPTWHRAKYYHIPCQSQIDLTCFYDDAYFMCLCNTDRHANCFKFEYNQTDNCFGYNYCQNDGECHQDNKTCPTTSLCFCKKCYFGTYCQFTTTGFGLSLDNILGYSIWPNIPFSGQPLIIKTSTACTILMFLIAVINSTLSFITFRRKRSLNVGCGYYLLTSSIISIATMTLFTLKYFLLVFSQMSMITNHTFLLVNCMTMDMLLKSLLAISDWLNACVAVERVMTAYIGVKFNKKKSKQYAKWIIFGLCLLTVASYIPDTIYRQLLDDNEEQRKWCVIHYSSTMQIFTMIINIIHFCIPLGINVVSVLIIMTLLARQKSTVNRDETYREHLWKQFHQHKHRLFSSIILILIAMPRLIISFLTQCMESAQSPGLYLAGYFISFIPPLLGFVLFALPSEYYRKEFKEATLAIRKSLQRRFRRQEF